MLWLHLCIRIEVLVAWKTTDILTIDVFHIRLATSYVSTMWLANIISTVNIFSRHCRLGNLSNPSHVIIHPRSSILLLAVKRLAFILVKIRSCDYFLWSFLTSVIYLRIFQIDDELLIKIATYLECIWCVVHSTRFISVTTLVTWRIILRHLLFVFQNLWLHFLEISIDSNISSLWQ